MGVRGELFSTKVALQNRTYFFNVKENRLGDLYLNIVESKNRDEGGFERQSVILFADDLQEFLRGFDESLRVLEKAVREKRRGPPNKKDYPAAWDKPQNADTAETETPRRGVRFKKRDDDSPGRSVPPRKPRFSDKPHDKPYDKPQWKRSDGPGRNFRGDREGGGQGNRRPRYENKDRDHKSESYRSRDKQDSAPRKKRVVVKKR